MHSRQTPVVFFFVAMLCACTPALAQYGARRVPDPATGERYRVEFAYVYWKPTPEIVVASESLGIPGTDIDFPSDLGIEKKRFRELRLVLRATTKAKIRFSYLPISYQSSAVLTKSLVFNGIRYSVGQRVDATFNWKTYRFGYEYDFLYRDRGFAGFILEAKYTDIGATLESLGSLEFASAKAPLPAIGGIVRVYAAPNIAMTFELTGFKLPDNPTRNYGGKYFDLDLYGTLNFNDYVGFQAGYRSIDVGYRINNDDGNLTLRGLYFGGVARF